MVAVDDDAPLKALTAEQIGGTVTRGGAPELTPDYDVPLPQAQPKTSERTMSCPTYAGPMYLPYSHPKPVARRPVLTAALPLSLDEQPREGPNARQGPGALRPFTLDVVRLDPATRFGAAQRLNSEFLRLLQPDRLLFFFRRLANLPQPRPDLVPYGGWESQGSGLRGEFSASALP